MIERQIVGRIVRRALLVFPVLGAALWLAGGQRYAVSGAIGLGMTLLNLWVSARIIGGVAENNPQLLLGAGLATFVLGLVLLTGIALVLEAVEVVSFKVTGLVLIGSHLGLVLWEAAGAYDNASTDRGALDRRSPAGTRS